MHEMISATLGYFTIIMSVNAEKEKVERESVVENDDENPFLDPEDVQCIETGDSIKVKQVLDESIVQTLKWLKYVPEYSWENVKLLLMFISCIFAVIAQFAPIPFPDSRPLLGICCVGYFVLSGVLQFIELYIDEGLVMTIAPTEKSGHLKLRIESKFPRFQEWFTLSIHILDSPGTTTNKSNNDKLECTMYVGRYFTATGEYDQVGFARDVEKVLNRFTQEFISGNSNSNDGSKNIQMKIDKFSVESSDKKKN